MITRSTKFGVPSNTKVDPNIPRKNLFISRFNTIVSLPYDQSVAFLSPLFTEPIDKKKELSPITIGKIYQICSDKKSGNVGEFFLKNKGVYFGTDYKTAKDMSDTEKATILRTICYMNKIGFNIKW